MDITDPGPGAYNTQSSFKADLRKDPSKGASSAFKSKTKRLFSASGEVLEGDIFPGKKVSEAPSVGTYTPKDPSSIGVAAAAIARQAEKLKQLRRGRAGPPKATKRFLDKQTEAAAEGPGPGQYEPGRVSEKKAQRAYAVSNSAFRSGSRRALPWGGGGNDAPSSVRARKIDDMEAAVFDEPGPGEYVLQGAFHKAKAVPRRNAPGSAWTQGSARFAANPSVDKVTPSAVHYTPNYSYCS